MAALQATMLERGWKIEAADRWIAPSGQEFYFGEECWDHTVPVRLEEFLQEFKQGIRHQLRKEASERWHGAGLQDGVWPRQLAQNLQRMRRHGLVQEAGALQAMASALIWTPDRKIAAGLGGTDLCRCGKAQATAHHIIWECELNEGPIFDKTD